jgi:hypothetical protein
MAQINFNAAEIETTSRDAIPTGIYEAVVTDSEMRATKSGLGMGINLTFEILTEGPAKGRKVFSWINYEHPKVEAQRIGREELASLCKAVGVTELNDTAQLHNLPLMITVGIDRNDPTRNVVKKYAAKAAPVPAAQAAQKSPQAAGAAPWAR